MEEIRRQFRHDVNKKIDLKKIHRAVQVYVHHYPFDGFPRSSLSSFVYSKSSDYMRIHRLIIDSYYTTKVMKSLEDDEFMLQVSRMSDFQLNVLLE